MLKRSILISLIALLVFPSVSFAAPANTIGRILLDVEQNGEGWYVYPVNQRRYYLGRPDDAFHIMRELGLGISNADLAAFDNDLAMRQRLSGRILLQVEAKGEAYYVHPVNLKKYYLGRPADAFEIMSDLGLGISSADLAGIPTSSTEEPDIYYDIPFVAQAPFGDWGDQRQQEGCEETTVLMAMAWINGEHLSPDAALDEILRMSDWQEEEFGYFEDTSAHDTAVRMFNRWHDYWEVWVEHDISSSDVLDELEAGNVVAVTINGKKVNHPYYTPPGPDRHMLLVHGYDRTTGEFITHDPGTRHGEDHRISNAELDYMLRDYVSGRFAPITSERTAMIVISK